MLFKNDGMVKGFAPQRAGGMVGFRGSGTAGGAGGAWGRGCPGQVQSWGQADGEMRGARTGEAEDSDPGTTVHGCLSLRVPGAGRGRAPLFLLQGQ